MSDEPEVVDAPRDIQNAHALTVRLRAEGKTIGFDTDTLVEDFDTHRDHAHDVLAGDDVSAFFLTVERDTTDYSTSVIVDDPLVYSLAQIEMLGAHFRTVLDALPLGAEALVDAMVDEALTIDPEEDAP